MSYWLNCSFYLRSHLENTEGFFSCSSSPSYNQRYYEVLIWQATSLYLSGQWWIMASFSWHLKLFYFMRSFYSYLQQWVEKVPVEYNNVPFIRLIACWHSVQIPSLFHVRLLRIPVGNLMYILSLSLGCYLSVK